VFSVEVIPRLYHEVQRDKPVSMESLESAVSSWDTDPTEVFTDSPPWWRHGRWRSPGCCKPLHSNAKSCCEIDKSQRGQKLLNVEAEEFTALEVITRQPVKAQQTEKA
jgi:hypothetical protein